MLQANLTLQTIHTIIDREVSMLKPALATPQQRQPSQQDQIPNAVTTATEAPLPTATIPTPLYPAAPARHTDDDEDTDRESNPLIVKSENSISDTGSDDSMRAQSPFMTDQSAPAIAPTITYCHQNPRHISRKSKTPALRHIDVQIAPTLKNQEWDLIYKLGVTPGGLRWQ